MLRPQIRIPLWAAVAIPIAAYAWRSFSRGSARLDMPGDAIVLGALVFVLSLAALYGSAAQRRRNELPDKMHDQDSREDEPGQDQQI